MGISHIYRVTSLFFITWAANGKEYPACLQFAGLEKCGHRCVQRKVRFNAEINLEWFAYLLQAQPNVALSARHLQGELNVAPKRDIAA